VVGIRRTIAVRRFDKDKGWAMTETEHSLKGMIRPAFSGARTAVEDCGRTELRVAGQRGYIE
jgi:hypothetical protein